MMTWLHDFRARFAEDMLDVLWSHWITLGVFGRSHSDTISPVDPEALIIPTASFGRFDPRLFDAVIEWWGHNDQWLSGTRLQRMKKALPGEEQRVLAAVVESVLIQNQPKKWQRMVSAGRGEVLIGSAEPLFLQRDGRPLPTVGVPDPTFERHGFLRPRLELRDVAGEVLLERAGNFRLRLRGFFGVTSRAEIVLYLLTHRSGHPRLIARHAHYAYDTVANALSQLARSGYVARHRGRREVEYAIDRKAWRSFLNPPRRIVWTDWAEVFSALRLIWACVSDLVGRKTTDAIIGSELRQCAMRANRLLRESEVGFAFPQWEGIRSADYLREFKGEVQALFRLLRTGPAGRSSAG